MIIFLTSIFKVIFSCILTYVSLNYADKDYKDIELDVLMHNFLLVVILSPLYAFSINNNNFVIFAVFLFSYTIFLSIYLYQKQYENYFVYALAMIIAFLISLGYILYAFISIGLAIYIIKNYNLFKKSNENIITDELNE